MKMGGIPMSKIAYPDSADTRLSNFVIEYLRENEKVGETFLSCSYGAQIKSFGPKIGVENLVQQ